MKQGEKCGMATVGGADEDKNLSQQLSKGNQWPRRSKGIQLSIADTHAH